MTYEYCLADDRENTYDHDFLHSERSRQSRIGILTVENYPKH